MPTRTTIVAAHTREKRTQPCHRQLHRAIQLKPDYAVAYHSRGDAHRQQGRPRPHHRRLHRAIQLKPDGADMYHNRGGAYANKSKHDRAVTNYTEPYKSGPTVPTRTTTVAVPTPTKGSTTAPSRLRRAIRIKPDYADAYHNRGGAYADKGEYDRAIADFTTAIRIKPDHAETYRNRGVAHTQQR